MRLRNGSRGRVIGAVALAGAAALAMAGCSGAGGTQTDSKTLTVAMVSAPGFGPCVNSIKADYKAKTGETINVINLPYPALLPKLQTAAQAGTSDYDLVTIAFQWTGQLAKIGYLKDITSDVKADSNTAALNATEVKALTYDDKNYAVPFLSQVSMLFYRTDILEKAGLSVPTTQAEFNSALATLKSSGALSSGMYPVTLQGGNGQGTAIFQPVYRAEGGGPIAKADGSPDIDVSIAAKALTDLKLAVDNAPPGVLNADSSAVVSNFQNGKAAFLETFSADPGTSFETQGPDNQVYGKYSATALPGGHGDYGGWGLAVPKTSKNQEAAYKFASYLASPAVDLKCALNNGKGPAATATFTNAEFLKKFPYLKDYEQIVTDAAVRFTGPKAGDQNNALDQSVANFLSGQAGTADQAAQKLVDAVEAASK